METNDTQSQIRLIEKYELERLRKANSKFKLEIIELKQKLKEIYKAPFKMLLMSLIENIKNKIQNLKENKQLIIN